MAQADDTQPPSRRPRPEWLQLSTATLETISDGFSAFDHDWRYVYINSPAERILGLTREELVGRVVWDVFPHLRGSTIETAWRKTMDEREVTHVEHFYPEIGWLEEHVYPADVGVWIFFQNITDRKARQTRLEEEARTLSGQVRRETTRRELAEERRDLSEEVAKWSNLLADAERTFASRLDEYSILDTLVHLAVPILADAAGVMKVGKDGMIHHITLALADRDKEEQALEYLKQHPMRTDLDFGVPKVLRTGEADFTPRVDDDLLRSAAEDEEQFERFRAFGLQSMLAVPLIARERIIAAIWLASTDPDNVYDETDLARARDLAGRAALAVDNARLYRDLERTEKNARFIAEVGSILAASLDYEASLQNLAELLIPTLADYCVIDIVDDSTIRRIATAHLDPVLDELLRRTRRHPPDLERSPAGEVIRSGEPHLIRELSPEQKRGIVSPDVDPQLIETIAPTSIMLVPLTARGHTYGVITLAGVEDRRFDDDDLLLAQTLAQHAALMIDNARLYREAVEANRAKSDFLAVISHELRTPLNAIMGYTGLLEAGVTGPLTDAQTEQLRRIDISARHLLELIEEVLTYSRMEMGREEVNIRLADLGVLIREAAARAEPLARNKGLEFELEIPQGRILIETDTAKFRQILTNLLSNAVKFTESGRIDLDAEVDESEIEISVSDTGIGIQPDELERLFEPFWQHDRGTTRRVSGTGLGLSVSQRLANLLGGTITVQSAPGEGSTFTLRLPRSAKKGAVDANLGAA